MGDFKSMIHLFCTPGGYYIYDVNKNVILRIAKDIYEIIYNNIDHLTEIKNELIQTLLKEGFLSGNKPEKIIHPADEMLSYYLESNLNTITLQVTQNCNLNCSYCPYSGGYYNRSHSHKRMSLEVAQKSIDFLIERSRESQQINVGFYGGEPLLEIDLIKKCIAYSRKNIEGKDLFFHITTNGTLLTEDTITYFQDNNVNLTISLDGPRELHDKHRRFAVNNRGSFDTIIKNIETIENKFPQYLNKVLFNIVMDPENDFNCINNFFVNYTIFNNSQKNAVVISDKYSKNHREIDIDDFVNQRNYEIFKEFLSKLGRLKGEMVSELVSAYFENIRKNFYKNRKPSNGFPLKCHPGGPCIPGVQRLFVEVDGNLLPCERVSEVSEVMRIGHIDKGFDTENCRQLLNIGQLTEETCKNCWAFRQCFLCAQSADDFDCLSKKKKLGACQGVRYEVESMLKDYCVLKEFGYNFEDVNIIVYD